MLAGTESYHTHTGMPTGCGIGCLAADGTVWQHVERLVAPARLLPISKAMLQGGQGCGRGELPLPPRCAAEGSGLAQGRRCGAHQEPAPRRRPGGSLNVLLARVPRMSFPALPVQCCPATGCKFCSGQGQSTAQLFTPLHWARGGCSTSLNSPARHGCLATQGTAVAADLRLRLCMCFSKDHLWILPICRPYVLLRPPLDPVDLAFKWLCCW